MSSASMEGPSIDTEDMSEYYTTGWPSLSIYTFSAHHPGLFSPAYTINS